MLRKPAVQRRAEETYQIVMESLKTGNVAGTSRKHNTFQHLIQSLQLEVGKRESFPQKFT